jgi:hypothetical protein
MGIFDALSIRKSAFFSISNNFFTFSLNTPTPPFSRLLIYFKYLNSWPALGD